jgi:hypothetical protein
MDTLTDIEAIASEEQSLVQALTEARGDYAELEGYVTNLAEEIAFLHQELAVLQAGASAQDTGWQVPGFFELLKRLFTPEPALSAARGTR